MDPKYHLFASLMLGILLFPIFKFNAVYIIIGGFLIDIDHYLWYIARYRDFNIKKVFKMCKDRSVHYRVHIFHVVEFFIICIILSFYSQIFLIISIGLAMHYAMDFYDMKIDRVLKDGRIHSLLQLLVNK